MRIMAFIDGENLVKRFEAMLADGRAPLPHVVRLPGVFAWTVQISFGFNFECVRAHYYTSVVGDDDAVAAVGDRIRTERFCGHEVAVSAPAYLYPHVFKRLANSRKDKTVDIQLTVDLLSHVHRGTVDGVLLISGDSDFVAVAREAARNVRVYIAALSSGLHPRLPRVADRFIDLDRYFLS